MPFFKYLLFSLLLLGNIHLNAIGPQGEKCDSLEVTYKVNEESSERYGIIVTVNGGTAPFQYLFYSLNGDILSKDLSLDSVQNILKGKYFCIVRDDRNCRKTIEIEIK